MSKQRAKKKPNKFLTLDDDCWDHVDGSAHFDIDEAVPLEEDEIRQSKRANAGLQEDWDSVVAKPVSSITTSDKKSRYRRRYGFSHTARSELFILEYASLDPVTEVDENGDERYTEEKQDEYCDLCAQVEDARDFFNKGE